MITIVARAKQNSSLATDTQKQQGCIQTNKPLPRKEKLIKLAKKKSRPHPCYKIFRSSQFEVSSLQPRTIVLCGVPLSHYYPELLHRQNCVVSQQLQEIQWRMGCQGRHR